jgi:hypothetical protein
VDPVPDPLLLRKSGSAGNRTRTSESVARNSDHKTTEMVCHNHSSKYAKETFHTTEVSTEVIYRLDY